MDVKVGMKVVTLVNCCGVPAGTHVKIAGNKAGEVIVGAITPTMVMCTMPNGGGLYYDVMKELGTV